VNEDDDNRAFLAEAARRLVAAETPVRALVVTGAPGTGKSSVLDALGTELELRGVAYGAIESEQLAWGSPWLAPAQWLPQLQAVLRRQAQAGRRLFLVAATTETAGELRDVIEATGAQEVLVVCLRAAPTTVAERIDRREPDRWPGKQALIEHARALALAIPGLDGIDHVIDTDDARAEDVARRIAALLTA
jgi:chloramphenicol 3-O-phosphotransferase